MNNKNNDDNERHPRRVVYTDLNTVTIPATTTTTTTTTTINEETNSIRDEMTTTNWERSPIRRVNIVDRGPHSAFARLFPEKYRQQQQQQNFHSTNHPTYDDRYNFDTSKRQRRNDDENVAVSARPHRVSFYNNEEVLSFKHDDLRSRPKSDSFLDETNLNDRLTSEMTNFSSTRHNNHEQLTRHPLNYDPDPEIVYRDNPNKVVYVQKVGVRYLQPPTPPPPGPIVIREIQSPPPKDPPPLVVASTPPIPPRTPSPLIVREQPPTPPEYQPPKVFTKTLPPPPAPPRRVIIKRVPPLPAKPRPVIIEKWLPYKTTAPRPVVYERVQPIPEIRSEQRNIIVQYEPAHVRVTQEIQNAGCFRVDPQAYRAQHGASLRRTESIRQVLQRIGCNADFLTTTGHHTSSSSDTTSAFQKYTSSHYDYPRRISQSMTCFNDEQLSELLNSSPPITTTHHYDTPTTYRQYSTILSNA